MMLTCSQLQNIERIGDYAQNIAEDIHFIMQAKPWRENLIMSSQWEDLDIKTNMKAKILLLKMS